MPVLAIAKAEETRRRRSRGHPRGRLGAAHRRGRPALRAHPARDRARQGLQGRRRQPRPAGARARARVPPDRDHARRLPARHARLDGAQQPQARPAHPAHPGADALGRGGAPARPVARRVLATWSSRRPPASSRARSTGCKTYVAPHTKRLLVVEDNERERASIVELLGHDDIEIDGGRHRRRGARGAARARASTAASSTCGCPT